MISQPRASLPTLVEKVNVWIPSHIKPLTAGLGHLSNRHRLNVKSEVEEYQFNRSPMLAIKGLK